MSEGSSRSLMSLLNRPMPPWLPLTREGLFWGLIGVALLMTGLIKGINLLTLLACLLLVMLAGNYLLARRQLRSVTARRLDADPPFAGSPWKWRVLLTNRGRGSVRGLCVQAEDCPLRAFVSSLGARQATDVDVPVVFPERGRVAEGQLLLMSSYPLGLVEMRHVAQPARDLIVLPRLGRLHRGDLRALLRTPAADDRLPPLGSRRNPSAQTIFHGMRNFRAGDSPRLIHWRTSARRGEPMVREFEDPPDDELTLVVDSSRGSDPRDLEHCISMAATICWEWCRHRGDRFVLVVAGCEVRVVAGSTGPALARRALEALAVETGVDQADAGAVAQALHAQRLPAGPILVLAPFASTLASGLRGLRRAVVTVTAQRDDDELFQLEPTPGSADRSAP